jgi:hypothetical protein
VKSLNQVHSRSLILKDEIMKKYQFKKLGKWKKIIIKRMRIKFDRKKTYEGWNY